MIIFRSKSAAHGIKQFRVRWAVRLKTRTASRPDARDEARHRRRSSPRLRGWLGSMRSKIARRRGASFCKPRGGERGSGERLCGLLYWRYGITRAPSRNHDRGRGRLGRRGRRPRSLPTRASSSAWILEPALDPRTPSASSARAGAGHAQPRAVRERGDGSAASDALAAKLERIKRELNAVPTLPGVYLWKDKSGQVICVGKAKRAARPHAPVRELPGRAHEDPLLVDQIDSLRLPRGGEQARVARAGEEPHQQRSVLQRRLQGRQVLPFISAHEGATSFPPSSTRARSTAPTPSTSAPTPTAAPPATWWTSPAASCRFVRHIVRRLARAQAPSTRPARPARPRARPCFDAHVGLGPGACCGGITPESTRSTSSASSASCRASTASSSKS